MYTNYYQSNARVYTLEVPFLTGIANDIENSIRNNEPFVQSNFGGIVNSFVRVKGGLDVFMAGGVVIMVREG